MMAQSQAASAGAPGMTTVKPIDLVYSFGKKEWGSGNATLKVYPAGRPEDLQPVKPKCSALPDVLKLDVVQTEGGKSSRIDVSVPDRCYYSLPSDRRAVIAVEVSAGDSEHAHSLGTALGLAGAGAAGMAVARSVPVLKAAIPVRFVPYGIRVTAVTWLPGGPAEEREVGFGEAVRLDCDGQTVVRLVAELIQIVGRDVVAPMDQAQWTIAAKGPNPSWVSLREAVVASGSGTPLDNAPSRRLIGPRWEVVSSEPLGHLEAEVPFRIQLEATLAGDGTVVSREVEIVPVPLTVGLQWMGPAETAVGGAGVGVSGALAGAAVGGAGAGPASVKVGAAAANATAAAGGARPAALRLSRQDGRPAAGVPVRWRLDGADGSLQPQAPQTGPDGVCTCVYLPQGPWPAAVTRPASSRGPALEVLVGRATKPDGRLPIELRVPLAVSIHKPGFLPVVENLGLVEPGAHVLVLETPGRRMRAYPVLHAGITVAGAVVEEARNGNYRVKVGVGRGGGILRTIVMQPDTTAATLRVKLKTFPKAWAGSEGGAATPLVCRAFESFADDELPQKLGAMRADEWENVRFNVATLAAYLRVADCSVQLVARRWERMEGQLKDFLGALVNVFLSLAASTRLVSSRVDAGLNRALLEAEEAGATGMLAGLWRSRAVARIREQIRSWDSSIDAALRALRTEIDGLYASLPNLPLSSLRARLGRASTEASAAFGSCSGSLLRMQERFYAWVVPLVERLLLRIVGGVAAGESAPAGLAPPAPVRVISTATTKYAIDALSAAAGGSAESTAATIHAFLWGNVRGVTVLAGVLTAGRALELTRTWPNADEGVRKARREALAQYYGKFDEETGQIVGTDAGTFMVEAEEHANDAWVGLADDVERYGFYIGQLVVFLGLLGTGPLAPAAAAAATAATAAATAAISQTLGLVDTSYTALRGLFSAYRCWSVYATLHRLMASPVVFAVKAYGLGDEDLRSLESDMEAALWGR